MLLSMVKFPQSRSLLRCRFWRPEPSSPSFCRSCDLRLFLCPRSCFCLALPWWSSSASSFCFAVSFSLLRLYISFLTHFAHSTTFTSANLLSPCSRYEKGSSRVLNAGRISSPSSGNHL